MHCHIIAHICYKQLNFVPGQMLYRKNVAQTDVAWINVARTYVAWTNVAWTNVAWSNGTGPLVDSQG